MIHRINMETRKIYRSVQEMRAEGKKIRGLACATESWSKDLGGFREIIHRSALTPELLATSDIMLNVDHDTSKVLARSKFGKGSLRCFITDRGLEFETEAPATQLGRDMLVMLERGDYSQCSFCFSLPVDDEGFWHRNEAGELVREISKFDRLYDVSIVYDPAYDATEADARSRAVVSAFTHLDLLEKEINSIKFYEN